MRARRQSWFFLRGLVREAGHWNGFLERFEAAFPGCKAIALDLPGNGTRFREKSKLSVGKTMFAVREEFLSRRGAENHLFALSLGAMVGLEWLREWPGDFRSAVLLNTSLRGLSPFHHRLSPGNYPRIAKMLLSGNPERQERDILEMTSSHPERFSSLASEWASIARARPVSTANALRQLVAAARFHPPREKPACPVLLLNGAGDRLVNPACSREIARHWGLAVQMHPTAGHDLTLDEPEWVVDRVREFERG
jgi:pimeloyl-ACP methyl ester carboxylesterase